MGRGTMSAAQSFSPEWRLPVDADFGVEIPPVEAERRVEGIRHHAARLPRVIEKDARWSPVGIDIEYVIDAQPEVELIGNIKVRLDIGDELFAGVEASVAAIVPGSLTSP